MKRYLLKYAVAVLFCLTLFFAGVISISAKENGKVSGDIPLSEETEECVDCHKDVSPGIVEDWRTSRHSRVTPEMAIKKPELERRVSSDKIPDNLKSVAVGCYECHSLNPDNHKDNFEHADYKINVIVSPNDCRTCHVVEPEQFSNSKKAHAVDNLRKNPVYHNLVETVIGVKEVKGNKLIHDKSSEETNAGTCFGCHGTEIRVEGMKKIPAFPEPVMVPNLINWPNQGVGRINPDGSFGACTACHPRHSFSIEIARKPETCWQCHKGIDVPANNVYKDSKHGNIYDSKKQEWNWDNVPWRVGKDFKAPTCSVCHNSLIVSPEGDVIVNRTHDFGSRLWVRIFGLIYTHPQPKSGKTYLIKNNDGQPLPTTFAGEPASNYLIDKSQQDRRRNEMKKVCQACHSTDWADKHFARLDAAILETDKMTLAATQLVQKAWDLGLADKSNPFDEEIEQKWVKQWLFYANSIRLSTAMISYDYTTFEHGWWDSTANLQEMHEWIEKKGEKLKR